MTSANAVSTDAATTLTIGGVSDTFTVTTRSVDASGLYQGTGSVNSFSNNLVDVRGMIQNDRFLLFDAGENVLYDGQIQSIVGQNLSAMVDIYKDGVNVSQSTATGTVTPQTSISLTLTGSAYGSGTLSLTYDAAYEVPATFERFVAVDPNVWQGAIDTVTTGSSFIIHTSPGAVDNAFLGETSNPTRCNYESGVKTIPNNTVSVYIVTFGVISTGSQNCNHVGIGYSGFATVIDAAPANKLWFAATNGTNSNFSILTYL